MDIISRSGDRLEDYSRIFQIPLSLIKEANAKMDRAEMPEGLRVRIPGYVLQEFPYSRELLNQRALQNRLSREALFLVNPLVRKRDAIFIPVCLKKPVIQTKKFYQYGHLLADIEALVNHYPFLHVESIGRSVLGKDILEIRLGNGKRVVHYNGAFHANEWITTAVLMKWLNDLLLSLTSGRKFFGVSCLPLFERVSLSIVPMVNPDGVDLVHKGEAAAEGKVDVVAMNGGDPEFYAWKANIRGVDLNNQFPANWEIEKKRKVPQSPAPRDYPGDQYLTEPEAVAMRELAYRRNFEKIIALHTQGKEFYWGYEGYEPDYAACIAKEFEEKSGYRSIRYVDSHAGFKDWFIQEFKRPGFTIELGKGINPLPLSHLSSIYKETARLLLAGLYM